VMALTGAIFVLVEGVLIYFVVKYRSRGRGREIEGAQVHGHTRLELMWTAGPVLILAAITAFVFYKLPGIKDVPSARADPGQVRIKVDAHQFYWQFVYPNGQVSIDELHAPVNTVVRLEIRGHDVDHSWWIPELGGKFDAIPGHTNRTWFKANRTGSYVGQCGEFCGLFHAAMNAKVIVSPRDEYQRWVSTQAAQQLGRSEWVGACAKCHGAKGQGDYGPQISNNPIIKTASSLRTLLNEGRGKMPPVGRGWSDEQIRALVSYTTKNVFKAQGAAGG
jgi:cytochrome c oxidase subunit 2